MAETIILIFLLLPLYALLFYSYFYPEESYFLGRRWQFNEEPELSEAAITVMKFTSVIGIIILSMIIVFSFTNNTVIRLVLIALLFFYIVGRGVPIASKINQLAADKVMNKQKHEVH